MKPTPPRPDPITVPLDVTGRTIRAEVVDSRYRERDGRFYWRARVEAQGARHDVSGDALNLNGHPCRWLHPVEAHHSLMRYALESASANATPPARLATMEEVLSAWIAAIKGRPDLTRHSREAFTSRARLLVSDERFASLSTTLKPTTRAALEDARDRLGQTHASHTVSAALKALRAAWAWARDRGYVAGELPAVRVRIKLVRPKPVGTPGEAAAVLQHLRGWHNVVLRVILATGARPGEACALDRSVLPDLDRGWLRLGGKTGVRLVPIDAHGPAARGLRAELATRETLGGKQAVQCFEQAFRRARKAAGLEHLTPYAWRRATAAALRRAGLDIVERAAVLGHGVDVHGESYDAAQLPDVVSAVRRAGLEELPEGRVLELSAHNPAHKSRAAGGRGG